MMKSRWFQDLVICCQEILGLNVQDWKAIQNALSHSLKISVLNTVLSSKLCDFDFSTSLYFVLSIKFHDFSNTQTLKSYVHCYLQLHSWSELLVAASGHFAFNIGKPTITNPVFLGGILCNIFGSVPNIFQENKSGIIAYCNIINLLSCCMYLVRYPFIQKNHRNISSVNFAEYFLPCHFILRHAYLSGDESWGWHNRLS